MPAALNKLTNWAGVSPLQVPPLLRHLPPFFVRLINAVVRYPPIADAIALPRRRAPRRFDRRRPLGARSRIAVNVARPSGFGSSDGRRNQNS